MATVRYLAKSDSNLHNLRKLKSTVWPTTSNFTFFQLPLARSLARAATSFTSGVHEGKHYGNLLKMCAFAWGELVRESNSRQHTSSLHRRVDALVDL